MKKNILLTIIICMASGIFLSGCLSSGLPAPDSEFDTLVVVPILVIDGQKLSFDGEIKYKVYMDNIETGERETFSLSTDKHGYYYLRGIPAGKYSIRAFRTFGMNDDETYDLDFGKYLVIEEGALTVFPGKLTVYIFNEESNRDISYVDYWIREIDDDQILRIENFLTTEEQYSLWK